MCPISGLLFSQSSRQQSLWLPRGQKMFLSSQFKKLANISKPRVKKVKLNLLLAGFPFQSWVFFFKEPTEFVSTCTDPNTCLELSVT